MSPRGDVVVNQGRELNPLCDFPLSLFPSLKHPSCVEISVVELAYTLSARGDKLLWLDIFCISRR